MSTDTMTISLSSATSGYSLTDQVLTKFHRGQLFIRYTTMKGDHRRTVTNLSIDTPNDRDSLPVNPTLQDVVTLALKRQHPQLQYVAQQNGILIEGYFEGYSFAQEMACIEYGSEPCTKKM